MKPKFRMTIIFTFLLAAMLVTTLALAEDGVMFRKNVSKTPEQETDSAQLGMMYLYVPVQSADGTLLEEVEYYDLEGVLLDTRSYAKPLIATYVDELHHEEDVLALDGAKSGALVGEFDTFAAVSLDDGGTWKSTNLSGVAHLSSFTLADGDEYPGASSTTVQAVAGDRVMVAWTSKYCAGGEANYTLTDDEVLALQGAHPELAALYFEDLFGVQGNQKSVDYTLQGFPEVGEVPYSCVWTARGSLELNEETGTFDITWFKAERLTSGVRDANRVEIDGVEGAGFAIIWQEDPEGLRPGQGLGPGEGWSGAIVNAKTDLWYSYIPWGQFELVADVDETGEAIATPIEQYTGETTPKPAVPMSMPVRLTDNDMCKGTTTLENPEYPYCYYDFDLTEVPDTLPTAPTNDSDLCYETVSWDNPGGSTVTVCKTEDGRVLTGRIGASRVRFNMWPRDSDGDLVIDSAWVVMAYEETKALGEGSIDVLDPEPEDLGKNIWYHSFDMGTPDIVAQGGMLNQPAKDHLTGEFFELLVDDWGNSLYETEIARRFSLLSQPLENVYDAENDVILGSGTTAFLAFKQGILNQGGPADIFARRILLPDTFDPASDNPYAYENMACDVWDYTDGSNPNYLQGLCLSPAINVSGTNVVRCDDGSSDCAADFPWNPEDLTTTFPKVFEWSQDEGNLDDQSWENPYDVAKGHRGFIDGDFIMVLYAWSPNWQSNAVGNDHYNLYIRRSFDGGATWTTTPAALGGAGTEFVENYYSTSPGDIIPTTLVFGPGEFEQARNVSQLTGNKVTILDPRYSPTGGINLVEQVKCYTGTELVDTWGDCTDTELPYDSDLARDPSKYLVVYETGDNTTVAEGEAIPMDLFYSRATTYGDVYEQVEYYNDSTSETTLGFDWLEKAKDDLSGEASITSNLAGDFMYAIWNQWQEPEEEVVANSDAIFRRLMYLPDDSTITVYVPQIIYASTDFATYSYDIVTFAGSLRGGEAQGYEWRSSINGYLGNTQIIDLDPSTLTPGKHMIYFKAKRPDGSWTKEVSVPLQIGWQTFLPLTTRR